MSLVEKVSTQALPCNIHTKNKAQDGVKEGTFHYVRAPSGTPHSLSKLLCYGSTRSFYP